METKTQHKKLTISMFTLFTLILLQNNYSSGQNRKVEELELINFESTPESYKNQEH